ncbi:MAG: DUF2264 domain-containing protein [Anaerolineaceae bacterium]|nr:DUF2264 domain-containing protein [Anaerolineaceae bacterium]
MNPLSDNPLRSRADWQTAVRQLFTPLKPHFSPGAARVLPGHTAALYDNHAAGLEGFARPLWGLVPLAAGGGDFAHWGLYRRGLANGTNPQHREYWGEPGNSDQRLVEMAAVGLALALVPDKIWEPLHKRARQHLAAWLLTINQRTMPDTNWLFFRVLVNLGLGRVGAAHDAVAMHAALDRLEQFYLGDGWYADGANDQRDYYIPFAMHYYGLIYAKLAEDQDPERAQRFRQRAAAFAHDFIHWFAADGAALPFGRSLTYRFAQGGFWGALAFADVEALPWGVIKGLALRHLRWWCHQPIFNADGTLSIGYAYPNLNMAEQYNAPGSPYWAMKFFLPLALPESHPFWQADEEPLPVLPTVKPQPHAYMILCRDKDGRHVVALASGQHEPWIRHAGEKYAKFAYSTAFGFSVPGGRRGLTQAAADSMLALSDDGEYYRVRERPLSATFDHDVLHSTWQPIPGVMVETWLIPHPPWHIRIHRLRTDKPLWSAEGGFALDRTGDDPLAKAGVEQAENGLAWARYPAGGSGLRDLREKRRTTAVRDGRILRVDPNTNLLAPRTVLPTLVAQHDPGEHWLACAVLAEPGVDDWNKAWEQPPDLPAWFTNGYNEWE